MEQLDGRTRECIAGLIREHGNADYDPWISDQGYYCFYYLSSLRHALLDWYPFKGGSVLETQASYGPLTGLFLERADRVDALERDAEMRDSLKTRFPDTKLSVFGEELQAFEPRKQSSALRILRSGGYDHIFAIDDRSLYAGNIPAYLTKIRSLLAVSGTAVIGFRSKNGAKYQCGALDEYVTEPFQTEKLVDPHSFDEAARSVFKYVRYYYPFPDHLWTQAVYSGKCLPSESIRDRVIPIDPFGSPMIRREVDLYDEAVREGRLADVSNFVLAFLSDTNEEGPVPEQAFLSCDRGDRSTSMVFFSDGTVVKSPSGKGRRTAPEQKDAGSVLVQSFYNLEKLKKRGLHTVGQRLCGDTIRMPWIREQSLTAKIRDLEKAGEREGILAIFEEVYRNILRSSDEDPAGYDPGRWGMSAENAGVILRQGYIDLIPLNAFYTDSGFLYYDQEFLEEYCPAKYIMYRAVIYTYMQLPRLARLLSQEELLQMYGIGRETEAALAAAEERFIESVRNADLYRQVNRWSYLASQN